jgi:hypothetical protein
LTALEHDIRTTLERDERPEWPASELRRVVLRLADGEFVQAGTAPCLEAAKSLAYSLIRELDHPSGEWPRIGDRHIRPDAVMSVDILRLEN